MPGFWFCLTCQWLPSWYLGSAAVWLANNGRLDAWVLVLFDLLVIAILIPGFCCCLTYLWGPFWCLGSAAELFHITVGSVRCSLQALGMSSAAWTHLQKEHVTYRTCSYLLITAGKDIQIGIRSWHNSMIGPYWNKAVSCLYLTNTLWEEMVLFSNK